MQVTGSRVKRRNVERRSLYTELKENLMQPIRESSRLKKAEKRRKTRKMKRI